MAPGGGTCRSRGTKGACCPRGTRGDMPPTVHVALGGHACPSTGPLLLQPRALYRMRRAVHVWFGRVAPPLRVALSRPESQACLYKYCHSLLKSNFWTVLEDVKKCRCIARMNGSRLGCFTPGITRPRHSNKDTISPCASGTLCAACLHLLLMQGQAHNSRLGSNFFPCLASALWHAVNLRTRPQIP